MKLNKSPSSYIYEILDTYHKHDISLNQEIASSRIFGFLFPALYPQQPKTWGMKYRTSLLQEICEASQACLTISPSS